MKKVILLSIAFLLIFTQDICAQQETTPQKPASDAVIGVTQYNLGQYHSETTPIPPQNEPTPLTIPQTEPTVQKKDLTNFIKAGASMANYDKEFREFLDYGAIVSLGLEKRMKENISVTVAIDLIMLKGKWRTGGDRESIQAAAEEYFPGFVPDEGEVITAEDLPDVNLGQSYFGGGEALITSAESLQSIDIETTLFLLPITLNAKYWIHKEEKVNPYVGGGLGFCIARREVKSRAIKEESFEGPEYRIDLDKSQVVTGTLLNFLAGVEIPLKNNFRLVAEFNTGFYNLQQFDPILEISYKTANPAWYEGSDLSTWSYEDPLEIGVFNNVCVSSVMIGLVMEF